MDQSSPVMVVTGAADGQAFADQIANSLGYSGADLVIGSPADAAAILAQRHASPTYLVVDIGDRSHDILPELDALAEHCEPGTRVIVLGLVNDVSFYRELKQRGIIEYFTHPVKIAEIRAALLSNSGRVSKTAKESTVISFMSAASGDGSSTVALNTAHTLAYEFKQPTVLIDMDFQFGMIAKNLDLHSPFGIKELFEHPDRGIDSTLVARMMAEYGPLKVIAAPHELRLLPTVKPEVIRDLILTLQEQYRYVIIDLPHIWTTWVAAALNNSQHNVMVAQLWLRSVTHATRLLAMWRNIGIENQAVSMIINRSGAKFKEAISSKDFERVCGHGIDTYLANDIKAVVEAENQGKTITELGNSLLSKQIREFAASLMPSDNKPVLAASQKKPSLTTLFKR